MKKRLSDLAKKNHNPKYHDSKYHDTKKPDPANQCVACGAEMPEGDHVCKGCRDMACGDVPPGFDSRRDG